MSQYRVTVNGISYEVDIESLDQGSMAAAPAQANFGAAPAPAPVAQAAPQAAAPQAAAQPKKAAGGKDVLAPMQGKIISVNVTAGQTVKNGDIIAVLEAMKMENEIIAVEDATITSVNVTAGQSVEAGDSIVSLG